MKIAAPADVCIALLWVAAAAVHADTKQEAASKTYVVTIGNMKFDPQSLTVRRGDRVVWENKDLFPHTATAYGHAFDSGDVASQGSWTYVADETGTFEYSCTYHPSMKAAITVR